MISSVVLSQSLVSHSQNIENCARYGKAFSANEPRSQPLSPLYEREAKRQGIKE